MTAIKFEKDNKTYTLLSKTTKVTTPSIRIGNNYTPLFEGKPESEVISGDTIYTLSPLKVGKFNAAYKERPNFDGRVYAEINTWGIGLSDTLPVGILRFTGGITNIYTAQPGFTCKLGTMNYQDTGAISLVVPFIFNFDFSSSYQVISNVTNKIVSEGTFTCHIERVEAWPAGIFPFSGFRRIYIYDIKNNSVQMGRGGCASGFTDNFIT